MHPAPAAPSRRRAAAQPMAPPRAPKRRAHAGRLADLLDTEGLDEDDHSFTGAGDDDEADEDSVNHSPNSAAERRGEPKVKEEEDAPQKYRRYRLKQKERVTKMEDEVRELRDDNRSLRAREHQLLYVIMSMYFKIQLKDDKIHRLHEDIRSLLTQQQNLQQQAHLQQQQQQPPPQQQQQPQSTAPPPTKTSVTAPDPSTSTGSSSAARRRTRTDSLPPSSPTPSSQQHPSPHEERASQSLLELQRSTSINTGTSNFPPSTGSFGGGTFSSLGLGSLGLNVAGAAPGSLAGSLQQPGGLLASSYHSADPLQTFSTFLSMISLQSGLSSTVAPGTSHLGTTSIHPETISPASVAPSATPAAPGLNTLLSTTAALNASAHGDLPQAQYSFSQLPPNFAETLVSYIFPSGNGGSSSATSSAVNATFDAILAQYANTEDHMPPVASRTGTPPATNASAPSSTTRGNTAAAAAPGATTDTPPGFFKEFFDRNKSTTESA